jgi:hypothetical protein
MIHHTAPATTDKAITLLESQTPVRVFIVLNYD